MSLAPMENNLADFTWPEAGMTSVPYQVFCDPAVYAREQERIFRGRTWSYLALEAEVPYPGDFKATFVGDTPIVVSRDKEGVLHVFVNRCAHRGAMVCRETRGNRTSHTCIYHQWSYNLQGKLIGVPFRKGINQQGGYGEDFDLAQHSLQKPEWPCITGLIFASFATDIESLEDYIGPAMRPWLDRVFNRPVQILGYARQFIHANWKLYSENVKDPYHASLLHLFHTTFGIYRSSQGGRIIMDETGRHSMLRAYKKTEAEEVAAYDGKNIRSYQTDYTLADPSLLTSRKEFDIELTNHIQTIFPCLVSSRSKTPSLRATSCPRRRISLSCCSPSLAMKTTMRRSAVSGSNRPTWLVRPAISLWKTAMPRNWSSKLSSVSRARVQSSNSAGRIGRIRRIF